MPESSRDRFIRLAEKRTGNALKSIQLIGNLSNKTNYAYNKKDVDVIFAALNAEIKRAQASFYAKTPREGSFSLTD